MSNAERRQCPEELQAAINERFGLTNFGSPKFKLVWSETETITVQGRHGYEQRLLCPGYPCWTILRWKAPDNYGSPSLYDLVNRDPVTHMCVLGEYPYEGSYEVFVPLMSKDFSFETGMKVDIFEPDHILIDSILPMLCAAEQLSYAEMLAAQEFIAKKENDEKVEEITNKMMEDLPTRFGPVSYGRGGCKTSVIDRKMAQISEVWNRQSKAQLRKVQRGFYSR